jgi:hypothetical protein
MPKQNAAPTGLGHLVPPSQRDAEPQNVDEHREPGDLRIGDVVHYTMDNGDCRPAVVVRVVSRPHQIVDLNVFTLGNQDYSQATASPVRVFSGVKQGTEMLKWHQAGACLESK